jgi:hypothetical protein
LRLAKDDNRNSHRAETELGLPRKGRARRRGRGQDPVPRKSWPRFYGSGCVAAGPEPHPHGQCGARPVSSFTSNLDRHQGRWSIFPCAPAAAPRRLTRPCVPSACRSYPQGRPIRAQPPGNGRGCFSHPTQSRPLHRLSASDAQRALQDARRPSTGPRTEAGSRRPLPGEGGPALTVMGLKCPLGLPLLNTEPSSRKSCELRP